MLLTCSDVLEHVQGQTHDLYQLGKDCQRGQSLQFLRFRYVYAVQTHAQCSCDLPVLARYRFSVNILIWWCWIAGIWMHQAQEVCGPDCTVGGILIYSDKTTIMNNQMCYPIYSKWCLPKHACTCAEHVVACFKWLLSFQWQWATHTKIFWTPIMGGSSFVFFLSWIRAMGTMARTREKWLQQGMWLCVNAIIIRDLNMFCMAVSML